MLPAETPAQFKTPCAIREAGRIESADLVHVALLIRALGLRYFGVTKGLPGAKQGMGEWILIVVPT